MRRSYVSLIAGIALAVVAIVLMNFYVRGSISRSRTPEMATVQVVVANENLPYGTKLTQDKLSLAVWPKTSVPEGAFLNLDAVFADAKASGIPIVLVGMVRGQPVLRSMVSGFNSRPILSARVADGMRAVSIHIDDVSGVSGFILPGDHVDIILTRHVGTGEQNLVTNVIMQGIKVLGIDQLSDQRSDTPVVAHTATVEVTPPQAETLVLAQQAGTLSLSLRNAGSVGPIVASTVTEGDLPGSHNSQPHTEGTQDVVRVRYGNGEVVAKPVGQ